MTDRLNVTARPTGSITLGALLAILVLLAAPLLAATAATAGGGGHAAVLLVQAKHSEALVSPLLTGVNNDQWFDLAHGLWDYPPGNPDPTVVAGTAQAGIGLVRYPGGTPASLFDWKRAIGPVEQRGCQTDGRTGGPPAGQPRDSIYGPDEHMEFAAAAGAEAAIMVPFVRQTPDDAAGWVEYMNAAPGTNPSGGTAWADVRAANGHLEPYGVRFWEIGNEHDRPEQRYWMSDNPAMALQQYAFGTDSAPQVDDMLGKGCDFSSTVASDASPNQVFGIPFPPVVPDSQTVYVDGALWTEIPELSSAGPQDTVYVIDDVSGAVTFGDGARGAIPSVGAQVRADYGSGPHPGFVDLYAAMKAVDPSIDVCATWAPIAPENGLGATSFAQLMAENGHPSDYDCVNVHPYTNFIRQFDNVFDTAQEGHDEHMLGEAAAARVLQTHVDDIAEYGVGQYVTVSEFGALFFGTADSTAYRSWNTAMSHATYFASQWTRLANLGVPYAMGNTLVSETPEGLRAVLGGEPGYVYTSEAVVRELMRPLVQGGGDVVRSRIQNNPLQQTPETDSPELGTSYEALAMTATIDAAGRLNVLVVNRDSADAVNARVVPAGYQHTTTASVATVQGTNDDPNRERFESHNALSHPSEVQLVRGQVETGRGSFAYTFPPHSVTLIQLAPA